MSETSLSHRQLPFYLVDVFADRPLEGNPLAVVDGGDDLSDDVLRAIAREFNQSETTFVMKPTMAQASFRLRSFTASGAEVYGAGHNALGAWWWIAADGRLDRLSPDTTSYQEIGGELLPVLIKSQNGAPKWIAMRQEPPRFLKQLDQADTLVNALGLNSVDLSVGGLPRQVVWTGAPHLMVPVSDCAAVDRAAPDHKALKAVLASVDAEGCYVFAYSDKRETAPAYARFFNPTVGLWEDPATGTAAGPLGAYLVANGVHKDSGLTIEQGTIMGRRSLIQVRIDRDEIEIAGHCVVVASGTMRV